MKWVVAGVILIFTIGFGWRWWSGQGSVMNSPQGEIKNVEKLYDKYSFERLVTRRDTPSKIEVVGDKFYYYSEGRRISGEVNKPSESDPVGVIVMARGYVEKEGYKTGTGTHNAATYYAKNGYLTYAPDFSGYGESDPEDPNALGARLVKPVEILDLIASIKTELPIYLWGHSNGGQIMTSVAEVLGQRGDSRVRAVTLWAPVSKPFPYNILFYTDEAEDQGKWLRGEIAKFESQYDVFNYSLERYLSWIKMPIMLHQGTNDEPVPYEWSDEFAKALKANDKDVTYHKYPGADHNMRPIWNTVVARDLEFFNAK